MPRRHDNSGRSRHPEPISEEALEALAAEIRRRQQRKSR